MTVGLMKRIKELLNKIEEEGLQFDKNLRDEFLNLERLVFEIEDYWNGFRVSRYSNINELEQVS